jgi:1-acyl-sn-glycerol-3-phosphate acyltransferase
MRNEKSSFSVSSLIPPPSSFSLRAWLDFALYEATYWVSMALMTLGFSLRSEGRQHVPRAGSALLVANHQSFLDPMLVGLCSRRHLCFLARKTLFRFPPFGWFIRTLGAVPIDQEGVGKEGLRTILEELRAGRAVVVFPEGTRTPDGAMHELRPGIHLLIKRTQAPIIPVGIAGAFQAMPIGQTLPTPAPLFLPAGKSTLAVTVGRPLDARHYAAMDRDAALAELFIELRKVAQRAERLRRKA